MSETKAYHSPRVCVCGARLPFHRMNQHVTTETAICSCGRVWSRESREDAPSIVAVKRLDVIERIVSTLNAIPEPVDALDTITDSAINANRARALIRMLTS